MQTPSLGNLSPAKRLSIFSVLLTLCLVFSYLELLIPNPIPVPGCKLGLANLIITLCALSFSGRDAVLLALLKVMLSALLFGTLSGFWFSLAGALFSVGFLALTRSLVPKYLSVIGLSVGCAALHNLGQLTAAALLLSSVSVFSYLPWLLLMAGCTGTVSGVILYFLIPTLTKLDWFSHGRL